MKLLGVGVICMFNRLYPHIDYKIQVCKQLITLHVYIRAACPVHTHTHMWEATLNAMECFHMGML